MLPIVCISDINTQHCIISILLSKCNKIEIELVSLVGLPIRYIQSVQNVKFPLRTHIYVKSMCFINILCSESKPEYSLSIIVSITTTAAKLNKKFGVSVLPQISRLSGRNSYICLWELSQINIKFCRNNRNYSENTQGKQFCVIKKNKCFLGYKYICAISAILIRNAYLLHNFVIQFFRTYIYQFIVNQIKFT